MALDQGKLKDLYKALMSTGTETVLEAAEQWADMYAQYASDAQAFGLFPSEVGIEAAKTAMQTALIPLFTNVGAGTPADAASSISSALSVFWLTPPLIFSLVPSITVSLTPGTPALNTALITEFIVLLNDSDVKATTLTGIFDIFTKTVTVTNWQTLVTTTLI